MHVPSLIEKKRDGGTLSRDEIEGLIEAFTEGTMPDYQMSALAMAIFFRGMTAEETADLTRAMLKSGERMVFPPGSPRVVDKHSTGGVGDKVSLVLAPLLACDDLWVPMISGRGLGLTGGTLDKLEAIPGFQVERSSEEVLAQLLAIGVVMVGQSVRLCPADKKLYALRDVTGTIQSEPLLVSSIMGKKLAEALDVLVLDVKFGSGAFMKTRAAAESLGQAMRAVGEAMGVRTRVLYHPMDEPLGQAVGNALEVAESLACLRGAGPADLRKIVLDLAVEVATVERARLEAWLDDGTALAKFREMVRWQGGDPDCLDDYDRVHPAPVIEEITSHQSGVLAGLSADAVARASLALGAGRGKSEDRIDPAVGFDRIAKVGAVVAAGDVLARVHASTAEAAAAARATFLSGCEYV